MVKIVKVLWAGMLGILFCLNGACSGGGSTSPQGVPHQNVVARLEIAPGNLAISAGTTVGLVATAVYSDNTKKVVTSSVTWRSTNESAATVSNIPTSAGLITAVAAGSTKITASLEAASASTDITVTGGSLLAIEVTPGNAKVPVGVPKQFQATGLFSDNTTQDLTSQVAWSCSDTAVASVEATAASRGMVSALSPGSTTVVARLNGISGNSQVTVTDATLVDLEITPAAQVIATGTQQQFVATGRFSDASVEDLTALSGWSSSNTAVASVDRNGTASGVTAGAATISAAFQGVTGSSQLTVTSSQLQTLEIDLQYPATALGVVQQATATGIFADGSEEDLTAQVIWSSSAGAVAAVSNTAGSSGTVTSLAPGTTTITATLGGLSGQATLTVSQAELTSLTTTPGAVKIAVGTSVQFSATASATDGTSYEVTPYVSWGASDPGVATISNMAPTNGLATSVGAGVATVTASWRGLLASSTLTVASATLTSLEIMPGSSVAHLGAPLQMKALATFTDTEGSWVQDLTSQVTWQSSARAVLTISNASGCQGLATPLKAGTTTISAYFNGIVATTTVTVSSANLSTLSVTPAGATISKGSRVQMVATALYADGFTGDVTKTARWTSSDRKVAGVTNSPKKRRGVLIGVNTGAATITATLQGVSGDTSITVN